MSSPTHSVGEGRASAVELARALEAHRRELTGFCYRMLGDGADADDAVQESMLRAWRGLDGFEGRSTLRSWLFRLAHHVCIDALRSARRRATPMELAPSSVALGATPGVPHPDECWVQPILDDRVLDHDGDPARIAEGRESIRLAFVAALQHLPPKQRSALILCDVLHWQASEAAELLEASVASVNSALQRARATLSTSKLERLDATVDAEHESLLARYVDAFERYDVPALVGLLRDDAVLSMPPYPLWLRGANELGHWFANQGSGCRGARLVRIRASGSAAFGNYRIARPGVWEPFGIQILEVARGLIVGHHNFLVPARFREFGLPSELEA